MSEQLKNKMHQWEAYPPPGCWDAIASRLDDAVPTPSATRLYHFEVSPPPDSWNTIANALAQPAPVKRLYPRPWQIAAAAAVLLLLAGSARWFSGSSAKKDRVARQVPAPTPPAPPASNNLPVINDAQDDKEDNAATAGGYTGYSNTAHKPASADSRPMRSASISIQPDYREYPITVNYASMPEDDGTITRKLDPALTDNNYLVIKGPNGEITRASMKMADALRYLYGENPTEETSDKTSNENSNWKKRLQEWRNKIMSSHFIPASANFLDIIDLKDLVEEKP